MTAASTDPQEAFAELCRIRLSDVSLNGVLDRVAHLALTSTEADEVSVTLLDGTGAYTAAFTGPLAKALDEFQYGSEQGPCLDAAMGGATLVIADTEDEPRFADYARRAAEHGVRSSLAVGLPVQEAVTGALNLYGIQPGVFDAAAVDVAQTFAGYAAVALANAHSYDATSTLAQQMRDAMESRAVIEQAKGIVMAAQRCTADEAFATLSKASQARNRKLRDIAADVVAEASRPR